MKMQIVPVLAVLFGLVGARAQAPQGIERAAWLQGCWALKTGDRVVEEQWMAPRAGSMLGMSRTVRGNTLVSYETTLIREQGETLAFEAHPSGQPAATFLSTSVSASRVVFENAQHDFPQQVGYEQKGNTLLGWIAGLQKGKARRVEFLYTRVSCSAG